VWDGAVVLAQYLSGTDSPLHQYRASRTAAQPVQPPQQALPPALQQPQQQQTCDQSPGISDHTQQQQQLGCLPPSPASDPQQQQLADEEPARPGFTCLELGAGTGAVSLSLLAAGVVDYALLTDIPDMLPHLQSNVQHNAGVLDAQRALVLPLRWAEAADVAGLQQLGQQQQQQRQQQQLWHVRGQTARPPVQLQPPFELIVGSDLVYYR
jgi:hypothetical protein